MDINQLHEKASEALQNGNNEQAAQIYQDIVKLQPNDEAALSALMDIYQDTDKLKYYIARANYNIVNNKLEYGINDCKKALLVDASSLEAREKLARLYRVTNKNLKAIDEFTKLIEIEPLMIQSYVELIDLYIKEDSLESAINIAKTANEVFGDKANFNDILAKLYLDFGDCKNALEVVSDEVLKIKILLRDEKNEEAKEILDKIDPEKIENKEQKATYYLLLAEYYYNLENFDKSLELIDSYAKILGPNALSFQMRALCYEGKGDEFEAAYNFGYMNKSLNKPDEALVDFNNAFSINPKNKDVLIELAKLYEFNKEKYTAIDYWQKVFELDKDETARAVLEEFYINEGDNLMASKYSKDGEVPKLEDDEALLPEEEDEGLLNKLINFFSKKTN